MTPRRLRAFYQQSSDAQARKSVQPPGSGEQQATNSYGRELADSYHLANIKYLWLRAGATRGDERRARPVDSAPVVSHDVRQPVKSRRRAPVESHK